MAVEKNARWGPHLSRPLGIALLAWAGTLVATNLSPQQRARARCCFCQIGALR
jgi:hypothetical protein